MQEIEFNINYLSCFCIVHLPIFWSHRMLLVCQSLLHSKFEWLCQVRMVETGRELHMSKVDY